MLSSTSNHLIKSLNARGDLITQINPLSLSTYQIFIQFFNYFNEGVEYLKNNLKYTLKEKNNISTNEIPMNSDFTYIVKEIRDHIKENSKHTMVYEFKNFLGRKIVIHFTLNKDEDRNSVNIDVFKMLVWLFVITKHTKNAKCSRVLNIYIYLNDLLKKLPEKKGASFEKKNVNTGFTFSCIPDSEIVIFRKEEWFKVFLHETMHNFGLDFSLMNNENTKKFILGLFPVKSKVKLYEAYCDFWARTINSMLCSFFTCQGNRSEFLLKTVYFINLERFFSYFQLHKNLQHMNMTYKDLFSSGRQSVIKRMSYKEETSVLSYYIICSILLNDFDKFISWCVDKNGNVDKRILLQFKNTEENQMKFCEYIKDEYKEKNMIKNLSYFEKLYDTINPESFLATTLRKSLCEF